MKVEGVHVGGLVAGEGQGRERHLTRLGEAPHRQVDEPAGGLLGPHSRWALGLPLG